MQIVIDGLNVVAFASGIAGAILWYAAARVPFPKELWGLAATGGSVTIVTKPLVSAVQKSSRLNSWAAALTAVAVFTGSLANTANVWSYWLKAIR